MEAWGLRGVRPDAGRSNADFEKPVGARKGCAAEIEIDGVGAVGHSNVELLVLNAVLNAVADGVEQPELEVVFAVCGHTVFRRLVCSWPAAACAVARCAAAVPVLCPTMVMTPDPAARTQAASACLRVGLMTVPPGVIYRKIGPEDANIIVSIQAASPDARSLSTARSVDSR